MANFEIYKCSVCNRKTEKQVSQKHALISKCTITYKCTGTLLKIGESNSKTIPSYSSEPGIENWVPRGSRRPFTKEENEKNSLVCLNSSLTTISIAANNTKTVNASYIDVKFEVKKLTNSTFVEYVYVKPAGATLISGQDDSSKKLSLRFSNSGIPDKIVAYCNGVELKTTDFDRSLPGRIELRTPLTAETNQIKIVVFKQADSVFSTLRFLRNSEERYLNGKSENAWVNVKKLSIKANKLYSVFTCYDLSGILLNSQIVPVSVVTSENEIINGDDVCVLLANEPFSMFDRDLSHIVSIKDATSNNSVFEYKKNAEGEIRFITSETNVTDIFPRISILEKYDEDKVVSEKNAVNTVLPNLYIT